MKAHLWQYEIYRVEEMNMATARSSEIPVSVYQPTQCHTPEDHNISLYSSKNLKRAVQFTFLKRRSLT